MWSVVTPHTHAVGVSQTITTLIEHNTISHKFNLRIPQVSFQSVFTLTIASKYQFPVELEAVTGVTISKVPFFEPQVKLMMPTIPLTAQTIDKPLPEPINFSI